MKHPRALANEGITPERYAELRNACRQYPAYKRVLERARRGLEDRPEGHSGKWQRPDPTGNAAVSIAASRAAVRVGLIEKIAGEVAGPAIAPALIENVAWERPFAKLDNKPPCGPRQFYVLRLGFFILLDARL